jgi:hypothetical protein
VSAARSTPASAAATARPASGGGCRADEVEIAAAGCTVAAYPTNQEYDPGEPVVEATYPSGERRYAYPLSRLDPRVGVGRGRSVGPPESRLPAGQATLSDGRSELEPAG